MTEHNFEQVFDYKPRAERKKDNHFFTKFWVSILIISILVYVVAVFYFSWYGRQVSDALHYTFLPAIFGQLWNMSTIARKNKDVEIAQIKHDGGGHR